MSTALTKKIEDLEELVKKNNSGPSPWSKFNVGSIITIAVLIIGLIGSWFTLKAEVTDIRDDMVKVELTQDRHTDELQDVKLKGVQDSSDIRHIKEKIEGIDRKLDQLLEK